MNAEQKQAARNLVDDFKDAGNEWDEAAVASHMTALLQELVDAPEPEPVAHATGFYAGYLLMATVAGRTLPAGTALYTAPPAPSVPDGWRSAIAKEFPLYDEGEIDEGKHCCEWVMLQERKRLHKILAAPQPPKLSDERIDKICDIVERDNVLFSQSGIYALARAIEREILGGTEK